MTHKEMKPMMEQQKKQTKLGRLQFTGELGARDDRQHNKVHCSTVQSAQSLLVGEGCTAASDRTVVHSILILP